MLYLSFGSNSCGVDMARWCSERACENPLSQKVGTGLVLDYAPIFHYFSKGRNGGALDLVPSVGAASPCVLWEVDEAQLALIDRKEGAPNCCQRAQVVVQDSAGDLHLANTHLVNPTAISPQGFVEPSNDYLEVVRQGLVEHGLDNSWLNDCAQGKVCCEISRLFIYGTLMSGQLRHHALRTLEPSAKLTCEKVAGQLFDCGSYPGAKFNQLEEIKGEVLDCKDIEMVLAHCDVVEGFCGHLSCDNLYDRVLVKDVENSTLSWSYSFQGQLDELIVGGDWRSHGQ